VVPNEAITMKPCEAWGDERFVKSSYGAVTFVCREADAGSPHGPVPPCGMGARLLATRRCDVQTRCGGGSVVAACLELGWLLHDRCPR
jgi:hypothetical protein